MEIFIQSTTFKFLRRGKGVIGHFEVYHTVFKPRSSGPKIALLPTAKYVSE